MNSFQATSPVLGWRLAPTRNPKAVSTGCPTYPWLILVFLLAIGALLALVG